ncbi:sugar transferase [Spirosoma lacussanchae]|uniref:sugar transferase n=1 Tax=Spirosoma lacussanchae TaxID=1884249 RepID=UPI0011088FF4|nr:sugar transferase [Spirosoma lacussanchae]
MTSDSPVNTVDFRILYVEDNAERASDFVQAFATLGSVTVLPGRSEALAALQQGRPYDLVVVNDELGGLKFLNSIDTIRLDQAFAVMLLSPNAEADTNVQAEGQPIIDVFPLDYDPTAVRQRLTYLIRKKEYKTAFTTFDNEEPLRMPLGKRLFDIAVSAGVLLLISPLLLVVAVLIRLDSKGPILYKSKRIGMGYKLFDMYKFRTMRTGADKLISGMASQNMYQSAQPEQAPDALCETCQQAGTSCQRPLFQDNMQVCEIQVQRNRKAKAMFMKFKEDPRVTRLGKFLRNTSIDELPQLFNILKGDMSFVGNRPLPPYEAEKLTTIGYARRFAAPAGLTGLWQVTKRGKAGVSDQERIQLDALYARTYSFRTDLIILIRTVKAVFQKENV